MEGVVRKRILERKTDAKISDFLEQCDSEWGSRVLLEQAVQIDGETHGSDKKPYGAVKKELARIGVLHARITGIYALAAAQISNLHYIIARMGGVEMPSIQIRSLLRTIRSFPLRNILGQTTAESRIQLTHFVGDYLGNLYYPTIREGKKNDSDNQGNVGLIFYTAAATLAFVDFKARMIPEPYPLFMKVLTQPPDVYPTMKNAAEQLTDLLRTAGTPEFNDSVRCHLGIRIGQ